MEYIFCWISTLNASRDPLPFTMELYFLPYLLWTTATKESPTPIPHPCLLSWSILFLIVSDGFMALVSWEPP